VKQLFTILGLVVGAMAAYGQATTDEQLAAHYYREGDFQKAGLYYQKLYQRQKTDFYYDYYLRCLLQTKAYDDARKLVKTHLKANPFNFTAKVDMGRIYLSEGKTKQGEREFETLIKDLHPSFADIKALAEAFSQQKFHEWALKTYEQGASLLKNTYRFNLELADVYAQMNRPQEMVNTLVDLLVENEGYLSTVQSSLQRYASLEGGTPANDALKTRLIKESNKRPDKTLYSEMLIWLFLQEQNYTQAARQALALDKRMQEDGQRLYGVAGMAYNNGRFEAASTACATLLDAFPNSPMRDEARVLKLTSGFELLRRQGTPDHGQAMDLQKTFKETIATLRDPESKAQLLGRLAYLQAYFLFQPDTALDTYETAIYLEGLNKTTAAGLKLEYGDLLLASGFIWDAALAYGQVEKDFKYDVLGDDAKYRGARISFYTFNFDLAKAHLDILKGSTSKYISNDALHLSILITDNSTVDTTTLPLRMYAEADLLVFQKKWAEAAQKLDTLVSSYPGHSLDDDVLMLRYKIAVEQGQYPAAKEFLTTILERYSWEILADKALFLLAELHEVHLHEKEQAMIYYEQLLTEYKDSVYSAEARKRLRSLRGDQPEVQP
jgi:outer membrane protein assembly factor BamD (BamD/ComL family)